MSPNLKTSEGGCRLGRTLMSERELRRVGILARVKSGELKVADAARMLFVSYRQGKRLWRRYRDEGAKTYAAANEFLEKEYLQEHNQRFRHVAAAEQDYHRPAPKPKELDEIFRLETERVIGNDWVVRYENRYLQVQTPGRRQAPAKAKVVVCEWEDGRLEIRYRGQKLQWEEH